MNTYIDIETIPQQPEDTTKAAIALTIEAPAQMSKPETIAEWHAGEGKYLGVKDALIEDTYRKTSFDGAKGEVCSISFAVEDGEIFTAHRGEYSETELLDVALTEIRLRMNGRKPYFVGHNVGGFDLKFLFHRCVINNVNPKFDLCQWGRHGSQFYDTMQAWAGFGGRVSQDNLCAALGITGKPDDIDGSKAWDHYKDGKIIRIAEYNASDIETVRKIHKRLTFCS